MRIVALNIFGLIVGCLLAVLTLGVPNASAFEEQQAKLNQDMSPSDAFILGSKAYQAGDTIRAITALELAAKMGHPGAQWKLGQMYAEGDGVERDDTKAFEYFRQLADQHADDNPRKPSAKIVANAFVAVAGYYLSGIPDLGITRNLNHAVDLVRHAATYFGDTDAQYQLARMYLSEAGDSRRPERAARWLAMAAKDNHVLAQGELGSLLWNGAEGVRRRPILGLMWLEIARRNSGANPANRIFEIHNRAFTSASQEQRQEALARADRWIEKHPRD